MGRSDQGTEGLQSRGFATENRKLSFIIVVEYLISMRRIGQLCLRPSVLSVLTFRRARLDIRCLAPESHDTTLTERESKRYGRQLRQRKLGVDVELIARYSVPIEEWAGTDRAQSRKRDAARSG
jgi:hypothetical protein